jgi:hypothetical protein
MKLKRDEREVLMFAIILLIIAIVFSFISNKPDRETLLRNKEPEYLVK